MRSQTTNFNDFSRFFRKKHIVVTHVAPKFWPDCDSDNNDEDKTKQKKITLKCEYVFKGSHDFCLWRAAPVNGISVTAMEKRGKRGGGVGSEGNGVFNTSTECVKIYTLPLR